MVYGECCGLIATRASACFAECGARACFVPPVRQLERRLGGGGVCVCVWSLKMRARAEKGKPVRRLKVYGANPLWSGRVCGNANQGLADALRNIRDGDTVWHLVM